MTKVIFQALVFLSIIAFSGCIKDSEDFIPDGNSITVKARIFGIVVDENENPIDGAIVVFRGVQMLTDQYGIFKYEDAIVDSKHNFLTITKEGYFEGARTFRANHSKTIQLKTQLLRKNFNQAFESDQGGTANEGNAVLSFSPNSVMVSSSKADYNGIVKVAMKYLDPTQYTTNESMPGDLSAVNSENELGTLGSFGMVYVELQSPGGEKLQLKAGKTAEISAQIPAKILDEAPSEIAMWYFDNGLGLWKEEGKAKKENGKYVANVSHFSCWNYDYYLPSIILSGRVVDQSGNPLPGMHVWVSAAGVFAGGHGNTDPDGTFSGKVAKDVLLDFKVFALGSGCSYQDPVYITQIGPFSVDTNLGDIIITLLNDQFCNVTGTFLDCNGNPVTNGFAKIDNHYFELTNGTLDASVLACNSSTKSLIATDRNLAKTIAPIVLTSPGNNNLGTVNVCQLDADFLKVNCDALSISLTLLDSIYMKSHEQIKFINGSGNDNGKFAWIYIGYKDAANIGKCVPGTYDITNSEGFYYSPDGSQNNGKHYEVLSGSITITQGGNIGERIKGTYATVVKESGSGLSYDFYGSFQLLLE
jgi:hypothetical protein